MWIHLNDAFLSIVANRDDPESLLVRARVAGDIERTFPSAEVLETPEADYRYRATLPRSEVARVLAERVAAIDYRNFKKSVAPHDQARHDAYMKVWGVMYGLQGRAAVL
jgi:hypothetical protein